MSRWSHEQLSQAVAGGQVRISRSESPRKVAKPILRPQPKNQSNEPLEGLVRASSKVPKPRKYRNKPVEVGNLRFDSQKEYQRYLDLVVLARAGKIKNLGLQKTFRLEINEVKICSYRCDFEYFELRDDGVWEWIVEDVKSPASKTRTYIIKRKLMRAIWRVEIRET